MNETQRRILDGARVAAFKFSLQRLTVEDVSHECGVSRATIYRHFSGGRDQIIAEMVKSEVDDFLDAVAAAVGDIDQLDELLVMGLMAARRLVANHRLLQRTLTIEPEIVLPYLTVATEQMRQLIGAFLGPYLDRDETLAATDDPDLGDYLARMFLSYLSAAGSWDLQDIAQVRELVATQFLGRAATVPMEQL